VFAYQSTGDIWSGVAYVRAQVAATWSRSRKIRSSFDFAFCRGFRSSSDGIGDGAERSVTSMLVIYGAGFTIGVIAMYVWKKARKVVVFIRAGDT
jgi:hypothetical protein